MNLASALTLRPLTTFTECLLWFIDGIYQCGSSKTSIKQITTKAVQAFRSLLRTIGRLFVEIDPGETMYSALAMNVQKDDTRYFSASFNDSDGVTSCHGTPRKPSQSSRMQVSQFNFIDM